MGRARDTVPSPSRSSFLFAIAVLLLNAPLAGQAAAADRKPIEELVIQTTIPRAGYSLTYGFDAIWMMSEGKLVQVDPSDNSFVDIELPIGEASGSDIDSYRGLAVGEAAVWIPDLGSSTIYKVDPNSKTVTLSIVTDIFGAVGNVGVGEGSVWVITFDSHNKTLTRYSATTGALEAKISLPEAGVGVLVEYGFVWVTAANDPEVYKIDPATNVIVATIPIRSPTHLLAAAENSIWLAFDDQGIVQRIDAMTDQVSATIETGAKDMESDGDITAGGGSVWMINRGSIVSQIDPMTNSLSRTFRPPPGKTMGRRIRYGADALWISGGAIFRTSPPQH
jgi:DNA-binding beta-propeller fold protein YncE